MTAEGALLLPAGRIEIEPSVQYLRRETDSFEIVRNDTGQVLDLGPVDVDRNETTLALGLPWRTQFEVGVPFEFVSSERTTTSAALGRQMHVVARAPNRGACRWMESGVATPHPLLIIPTLLAKELSIGDPRGGEADGPAARHLDEIDAGHRVPLRQCLAGRQALAMPKLAKVLSSVS